MKKYSEVSTIRTRKDTDTDHHNDNGRHCYHRSDRSVQTKIRLIIQFLLGSNKDK